MPSRHIPIVLRPSSEGAFRGDHTVACGQGVQVLDWMTRAEKVLVGLKVVWVLILIACYEEANILIWKIFYACVHELHVFLS